MGTSFEQQWERCFALLTAFREREGRCEVPAKHEEQGVKLGDWLSTQRTAHSKGTLDAARRTRLEALGVVWALARAAVGAQLCAADGVPRARGALRGAARHEEQGVKLGEWLANQRTAHTKGTLDAARRTRLEALGVVWDTSFEQRWERCFALLTAFREREGHCEVPARHEEQGVKLGDWLAKQRTAHAKGTLDAARRTRLEALGVVWDPIEQQWERNFELLTAFREREGRCEVPRSTRRRA